MNHAQSTLDEDVPHAPAPSRGRAGVPTVVQFTEFEFDFERDQLRRNGTPIPLSPKPSALLRYFLANPQRLISKSELMESLWADVVVTDDSLVQCVGELRSRMGDQGPKLITTLPRRGYMFEADVRPVGLGAQDHAIPQTPATIVAAPPVPQAPTRLRGKRGLLAAVALGALVIAGGSIYIYTGSAKAPPGIDEELAKRNSIVLMPFEDIGSTAAPANIRKGLVAERFGHSGEPPPEDVAASERVAARALAIAPNHTVALINWANVLPLSRPTRLGAPCL